MNYLIDPIAPVAISSVTPWSEYQTAHAYPIAPGQPHPAALQAFQNGLIAPVERNAIPHIRDTSPGDNLLASIEKMERDFNQWAEQVRLMGTEHAGSTDPQQIMMQMMRSGEMQIHMSMLTNISSEMASSIKTLLQQQN